MDLFHMIHPDADPYKMSIAEFSLWKLAPMVTIMLLCHTSSPTIWCACTTLPIPPHD